MAIKTKTKEYDLLELLSKFIRQTQKGKHVQVSGKRITKGSIENYIYLHKSLTNFSQAKQFSLKLISVNRLSKRDLLVKQNYWKKFYVAFTNYLYDDLNCYDNYVSTLIKRLRAFFNYLNNELNLNVGNFHKRFYAPMEEIQIAVLSPERFNFLVENKEFHTRLPGRLQRVKDLFVLGSTIALRFSDLIRIKAENLEYINDRVYLNMRSQKTQTLTCIKLPDYAVAIIDKYWKRDKLKLPFISNFNMNKYVKEMSEAAGWTEAYVRTRNKRKMPHTIYKDKEKKIHFRFCDMITTHTMRRTAITTLLSLGMPENEVRKISGHSAGSKEFYRYLHFSQTHMDDAMDKVHAKLKEKKLLEAV